MRKKLVAQTILVLFLTMIFSVVGICFSAFKFVETKIVVQDIRIKNDGIKVYADKGLKSEAKALKLSDMELGLKPVTGKQDEETLVPSTINDEGTSEGYYSKVYVKADQKFSVLVKNIKIKTKLNQVEAEKERKNIFISIKDVIGSTKSLEKNEFEIASFESGKEPYELTFLIWLGSLAGEELSGAKISFDLYFVKK